MSSSSQNWLSLNLKISLLVGSASLSAIGTTFGVFSGSNVGVLEAVKNSANPIVQPFKDGYSKLSSELDNFSRKGYNVGIDATTWVAENFDKSRIKNGGSKIYENLKSWYETVKSAASGAGAWVKDFFVNWEGSKETMHSVFKSLGNTFSLIGSFIGGSVFEGESKFKILLEAIGKPTFKDFMNETSSLISKNPNLMPSLEMKDVLDVVFAFNQDESTVISALKELNKETEKDKVNKEKLLSSLKLLSLFGEVGFVQKRAKALLANSSRNTEEVKKVIEELKAKIAQLEAVIKSNEEAQAQAQQ